MKKNWSAKLLTLPVVLVIVGILGAMGSVASAFIGIEALTIVLGAVTAVAAILLTFIVARRQDDAMSKSNELLRIIAERNSAQDYEASAPEPEDSDVPSGVEKPLYSDKAIEALKLKGACLDYDRLEWKRKETIPASPGNHGWFVESPEATNGRWFVRKARGITVRKAMPRKFLERLEEQASLDPREIKLDFQLKEHGLAAWYARTYSGDLWKVWQANRNSAVGIQVLKVEDDEEAE